MTSLPSHLSTLRPASFCAFFFSYHTPPSDDLHFLLIFLIVPHSESTMATKVFVLHIVKSPLSRTVLAVWLFFYQNILMNGWFWGNAFYSGENLCLLLPGSCSLPNTGSLLNSRFHLWEFQATEYVWISELKPWTCRLQIRKTQERLSSLGSEPTLRRKCTPTVQDFYCGITSYLRWFCLVPWTSSQALAHSFRWWTPRNSCYYACYQWGPFFPSLFLASACYPF